jgi:hypothetical protein
MLGYNNFSCGITAHADNGNIAGQERLLVNEIERRGYTLAGYYTDNDCLIDLSAVLCGISLPYKRISKKISLSRAGGTLCQN